MLDVYCTEMLWEGTKFKGILLSNRQGSSPRGQGALDLLSNQAEPVSHQKHCLANPSTARRALRDPTWSRVSSVEASPLRSASLPALPLHCPSLGVSCTHKQQQTTMSPLRPLLTPLVTGNWAVPYSLYGDPGPTVTSCLS